MASDGSQKIGLYTFFSRVDRSHANISIAILSVYDKTGLLDLAKGLVKHNIRLLASGGTAKLIREGGFPVEYDAIHPNMRDRP